ncbi:MAG: hypothetical protein RLZZ292_1269 [Bacteroidota bacterium]|jgi:hypothetical protein
MTKREIRLKINSLFQSLELIRLNENDFLKIMSKKELDNYIDNLLDQINHFKQLLNNLKENNNE